MVLDTVVPESDPDCCHTSDWLLGACVGTITLCVGFLQLPLYVFLDLCVLFV